MLNAPMPKCPSFRSRFAAEIQLAMLAPNTRYQALAPSVGSIGAGVSAT